MAESNQTSLMYMHLRHHSLSWGKLQNVSTVIASPVMSTTATLKWLHNAYFGASSKVCNITITLLDIV